MSGRAGAAPAMVGFVLAVLGLAISLYLTIEHYSGSASLACPATGAIDCVKVTTSRWSMIAGVPVAVLGLAYFLAMTLLTVPVGATQAWNRPRVALAALGSVMVLYLIYVELFRVDAVCLWCTAVHVITIALLATTLWQSELSGGLARPTRSS